MKFPVDIIRVEDRIVLIQGYTSYEFLQTIKRLEPPRNLGQMDSVSVPAISCFNYIYLNGENITDSYKFITTEYTEVKFNRFQQIIEYYKRTLGYDE